MTEEKKCYPDYDENLWLRSCKEEIVEPIQGKITGKNFIFLVVKLENQLYRYYSKMVKWRPNTKWSWYVNRRKLHLPAYFR